MKMYDDAKMNDNAEQAVVQLLAGLFNDVAYMVPEDVRHNIQAGCEGGFSLEDRTFKSGTINYLLSRFSLIFIGLITNDEFRSNFIDAIAMEQNIEDQPIEKQKEIRNDMNSVKLKNASNSTMVVNFSNYDDEVFKKISGKLYDSFMKLDGYDEVIDSLIDEQSDEAKEEYGFIVSQFMYLLRAFEKNTVFFAYVSSVLKSVQAEMELEF